MKASKDYVSSGHLCYLGKGKEDQIDERFVLDQFSDNRSLARRRYRQFVGESISSGHQDRYYQVKDQQYPGEDDFIQRIKEEGKGSKRWVYDVPLQAISGEVSRAIRIRADRLHSGTRGREGAHGRGSVTYMAKRISGYTVKEIADYFRRSSVTISEAIVTIDDHTGKDESLEKAVSSMEMKLITGRKRNYRISDA